MMVLPNTNFPGLPSECETIWEGIVKVDPGLMEYVSSQGIRQDGFKVFTVRDSKYQHEDNAQLDNPLGSKDFPNKITLFVEGGEILEYMSCLAIKYYEYSSSSN